MSGSDPSCPLLAALQHLFDHEEELPDDPTAMLKRIGWVFAEKLYEAGESGVHSLDSELQHVCDSDARNKVAWCPVSFSLRHPFSATPLHGWCLDVVLDVDSLRKNAKSVYKYRSPVDDRKHNVHLTIRMGCHEFACFQLKGRICYWHSHAGHNTIVADHGGSLGVLHGVAIRAATVTYARYEAAPAGTCLVHRLFTTSHESYMSIKRFREDPSWLHMPYIGNWAIHNQLYYDPAHDAVLNHNEGTNTAQLRLEKLAAAIRAITKHDRAATWTELPLLSAQLSRQRRSRFVRIARTLLIHRAQAREEARARDPVKKCAACAIEAVKSQLALGIEPASKRQRGLAA